MRKLTRMSVLALAVAAGAFSVATVGPRGAQAQTAMPPQARQPPTSLHPKPQEPSLQDRLNDNTVSIISGNPNGGYLGIAYDIATIFHDDKEMRVLPIVGRGAVQNMIDVLLLRGIDMGLTNPSVLDHFKKTGRFGADVDRKLAYITALFQDELHVLAASSIKSFEDLDGKRVNFSDKGSGTQLTAHLLFEAHGIAPQEFNMGQAEAIRMIEAGKLDATLCTCLKPLRPMRALGEDSGLKLIPILYDSKKHTRYLPTQFTHEDYPNLVPEGTPVETIAVPTILAVYNWPKNTDRYRRVARFVEKFFGNFKELHKPPRHPRWKTVNFAAEVPGWTRFPAAQEWIDKARAKQQERAAERELFEQFLSEHPADRAAADPADPESQQALYEKFQEWERRQKVN